MIKSFDPTEMTHSFIFGEKIKRNFEIKFGKWWRWLESSLHIVLKPGDLSIITPLNPNTKITLLK